MNDAEAACVEFSFEIKGSGWACCRIQIGEAEAFTTASFMSDAPSLLIEATTGVLDGLPTTRALFAEEPGGYLWILEQREKCQVRVRILELPGWLAPDAEGKEIFSADCRLRTFAGAVLAGFQRLEREHGAAAYRQMWRHEFPARELAALKALLRA